MEMLIYLHFAGYLQLICGGKTALHANSSSEATGLEDWRTIHGEAEVMKKSCNPYASYYIVCTFTTLLCALKGTILQWAF